MKTAIRIDKPCTADWKNMDGDTRRRMCALCDKNVHNLSEMAEPEAEALVAKGGKICVRYTSTLSGRILHRPSPLTRLAVAAVSMLAVTPALASGKGESNGMLGWIAEVVESLTETEPTYELMGDIAIESNPIAVENRTSGDLSVVCNGVIATAEPGHSITNEVYYGDTCTVVGTDGQTVALTSNGVCTREQGTLTCATVQ